MKLAVAQLNTHAGSFAHTAQRIVDACHAAAEQGAELVVFPACVLTGPIALDKSQREGHQIDLFSTLEGIAQEVACPCLVPAAINADGITYHELCFIREKTVVPLRAHSYLLDSMREPEDLHDELDTITLEHAGIRLSAAFTYEGLDALVDGDEDSNVVLFIPDYGYALDDVSSAMGASLAESRFREDAVALDAWLVGVASLGGYGLQTYTGSSFVLSPNGDLRACAPAFEESLLVADVCQPPRSGDVSGDVPVESASIEPEIYNRSLHLWEALTIGLRDYVQKLGHEEVALVLDHTLATNLLAVLASDALGPVHVHAVLSMGLSEDERVQAEGLAATLRIHVDSCPVASVPLDADEQMRHDVSQTCLAHVARRLGAVALSPEDKTFLAVEATSTTCRAAELLPFGDVYRSDLIELAHLRNTISPVFPHRVFQCFGVPSIEGLPQVEATPEMQLRRLDVTLSNHIEWERSLSDCAARQGAEEVTLAILRLVREHEVGRGTWPPCLAASTRPLISVHAPLGYAWRDTIRDTSDRLDAQDVLGILSDLFESRGAEEVTPASEDLTGLLEGLEVELMSGPLPEGVDRSALEGMLGDLLGLLRDMAPEGGRPQLGGPFGPLTWGSPFSEN